MKKVTFIDFHVEMHFIALKNLTLQGWIFYTKQKNMLYMLQN